MPLGTTVLAPIANPSSTPSAVAIISNTSGWIDFIDVGGLVIQDAATIINPTVQVENVTRKIVRRQSAGNNLVLRVQYPANLAITVSPIVRVFGRANATEVWTALPNLAAAVAAALTCVQASDVTDGTNNFSTVLIATQQFQVLGCNEILVGVQTIIAGTVGTAALAKLQGKFV